MSTIQLILISIYIVWAASIWPLKPILFIWIFISNFICANWFDFECGTINGGQIELEVFD